VPGSSTKAFCTFCKEEISAHKKTLDDHSSKNKKHIFLASTKDESNKMQKITNFAKPAISEQRKVAELKTAVFIAKHCATNAVDDLGEVIAGLDPASQILSQVRLHRTKCTG